MSKELTEQWRNGTLEDGFYYVKENDEVFISHCSRHYLLSVLKDCEVLASVPSYEEWVKNGTWYTEKSHNELLKKIEKLEQLLESETLAKNEGVEIVAELENAIASQADYFQQQISVLEDRVKELEIQIGAYESCLALMPDSFEGVEK